jgi:hypothetical protein
MRHQFDVTFCKEPHSSHFGRRPGWHRKYGGIHVSLSAGPNGIIGSQFENLTTSKGEDVIRIYSHSNIIYWWPVWLYAAICWAATAFHHVDVNPDGLKAVKVFPSPWLGGSFLCVLFFVIVFSNIKTRGLHAVLVAMTLGLLAVAINWIIGLSRVFDAFNLLVIYMNEAFYGVTAVFLFILWLVVVFGVERLTYYRFTAGRVVEEHLFQTGTGVAFDCRNMVVRRLAGDFFRHQILGLGLLGLGTGDFVCKPSAPGTEPFILENVVFMSSKFPRIEKMTGMTNFGR